MKFNKSYLLIAIIVLITPIVLGIILNIPTGHLTIGDESSWVGFFGNYSGGIIGGIVAYLISRSQIKKIKEDQLIINMQKEKNALFRVKFELSKIQQEFNGLLICENPLDNKPQHTNFFIRKLNSSNWNDIGIITDTDLQMKLMNLEDFYSNFVEDLLNNSHDLNIQRDRANQQLESTEYMSPIWFELKELVIRKNNEIMIVERSREVYWKKFVQKRIELPNIIKQVDEKIKVIEQDLKKYISI